MSSISLHLGVDGRSVYRDAFDAARISIDAEFYSLRDRAVVASLNRAAERGVRVRITLEGDVHRFGGARTKEPTDRDICAGLDAAIDVVVSREPHPLVHGKAAVVDDAIAIVSTANATTTGFGAPGEVVAECRGGDVAAAVAREVDEAAGGRPPHSGLRDELRSLFASPDDLRIASEDLSDWRVVAWLIHRRRAGHHDRVLVARGASRCGKRRLDELARAGVDVRTGSAGYMHEKFVDAGDRIYIGSANLTRNGIDESYEVGLVAGAGDFIDGGAAALRADFDRRWSLAQRLETR